MASRPGQDQAPSFKVKDLPSKLDYLKKKLPDVGCPSSTFQDLFKNLRQLTSDRLGVHVSQVSPYYQPSKKLNGDVWNFPERWVEDLSKLFGLTQEQFTDTSLDEFKGIVNDDYLKNLKNGSATPPVPPEAKTPIQRCLCRVQHLSGFVPWLAQQLGIEGESDIPAIERGLLAFPFERLNDLDNKARQWARTNPKSEAVEWVRRLIQLRWASDTGVGEPHPLRADINRMMEEGSLPLELAFDSSLVEVVVAARDQRPVLFRSRGNGRTVPAGQGLIAQVAECGRDDTGSQQVSDTMSELQLTLEPWDDKQITPPDRSNDQSLAAQLRGHLDKCRTLPPSAPPEAILKNINERLRLRAADHAAQLASDYGSVGFSFYVIDESKAANELPDLEAMKQALTNLHFVNIANAINNPSDDLVTFQTCLTHILSKD